MSKKIVDEELISSFKMKISKSINEGGIIGLSAALVRKSGPIWLESFGFTDASKQQKVDENTLFSLQSTTKTVTAVAFLLAVQKGLVGLDDLIHTYCPELKMKSIYGADEYKKITFRHLLSHSSSLPREPRIGGCFSRKIPESFEEHILSINDCWLQGPVGSTYKYSNIGMDLVPYLLEKIVKKPYAEYLQDVLGDPLGIIYHWSVEEIFKQSNVAQGYLSEYEAHKLDSVALGCGGAYISIKDQATFVKFLLNKGKHNGKQILEEKYIDMLCETKDGASGYGLGTTINYRFGTMMYSHAGGGFGYGSEMYWLPEHNFGLAVVDNSENAHYYPEHSVLKAVISFLEDFSEKIGIDKSPAIFQYSNDEVIELPKESLQRLEGKYESNFFAFNIKEVDGKLLYQVGGSQVELQPHTELAFTTTKPYGLIFDLDKNNKPLGCKLFHSYEGLLNCKYLGITEELELPSPKPEWKKYTGIYYVMYYYTEYNFSAVTVDDEGYLKLQGARLIPHESIPNIFYTENGVVAEFFDDKLYFDNSEYTKKDDVVEFFANLIENDSKHRALLPWIFDALSGGLDQLGRKADAEKMKVLKKKHFKK
ncbi:MAG: serine hydrolase domain-containing protein [Candidatus Heimdallarchaeota archaeon]